MNAEKSDLLLVSVSETFLGEWNLPRNGGLVHPCTVEGSEGPDDHDDGVAEATEVSEKGQYGESLAFMENLVVGHRNGELEVRVLFSAVSFGCFDILCLDALSG